MGIFNKLFNKKQAKPFDGRLPSLWVDQFLRGLGIVSWNEANDETYIHQGYQINPTVYSVISMAGKAAGPIPWNVYKKNSDGSKTPTTNVLLEELLKQPNPLMSWNQFVQESIGFKMLHGNTFIWGLGGNSPLTKGTYNSLWTLPSQYVRIVGTGNLRGIKGYTLDFYGSESIIPAKYVMHLKDWNPDYNETGEFLYGQSPLRAVLRSMDTSNQAVTSMKSYLDNQGPKGVLSAKNDGTHFTEEQARELTNHFKREYNGSKNANKTVITPNEFSYTSLGLSPADMQLMEQYKVSNQDICNAYNFPSLLLQPGATYANNNEAKKMLYNNVVIPLLTELRDGLNQWLSPLYGDDICLDFDISGVRELQEDFQKQAMAVKGLAGVLTVNEIRNKLGYEPSTAEGADEFLPLPNQQVLDNGTTESGDRNKPSGTEEPKEEV